MKEVWKSIVGYSRYEISNKGRVKSLCGATPRILKLCIGTTGYLQTSIVSNRGKRTNVDAHRLQAKHFLDGYFPGAHVNHIDGNKLNNDLSNFEWVTREDNTRHAFKIGLIPDSLKGWDNPRSRPIVNIETGIFFANFREAAIAHGLKKGTLSPMLYGQDRNTTSLRFA